MFVVEGIQKDGTQTKYYPAQKASMVANEKSMISDTGTRTLVSYVRGSYDNHLHHIGKRYLFL